MDKLNFPKVVLPWCGLCSNCKTALSTDGWRLLFLRSGVFLLKASRKGERKMCERIGVGIRKSKFWFLSSEKWWRKIHCVSLTDLGGRGHSYFGNLIVFPSLEPRRKCQSSTGLTMEAKIQMFWRLPAHPQMFPACSEHPRQKGWKHFFSDWNTKLNLA
jgi:hypothetical protein